jgi:hypothetical protein
MAQAAEHAVLKAKWMVALKILKTIPAAAAKGLPQEAVHWLASQAEVDCTSAEFYMNKGQQLDLTRKLKLKPAMLNVVVHQLQVCDNSESETIWQHHNSVCCSARSTSTLSPSLLKVHSTPISAGACHCTWHSMWPIARLGATHNVAVLNGWQGA